MRPEKKEKLFRAQYKIVFYFSLRGLFALIIFPDNKDIGAFGLAAQLRNVLFDPVVVLERRVFKIASKSYAFFAYSIDAFDYQVRRKVFNRPFLNMAVSSILQPFFEFEVNSSVLVG